MLRRVAARSSPPAAPPGRICQVWLQGGARAAGGLLARHPEGELTVLAHKPSRARSTAPVRTCRVIGVLVFGVPVGELVPGLRGAAGCAGFAAGRFPVVP
jgi:hypothetical protein